jgi:hypothetical protein
MSLCSVDFVLLGSFPIKLEDAPDDNPVKHADNRCTWTLRLVLSKCARVDVKMLTYADVCWRMLTDADGC